MPYYLSEYIGTGTRQDPFRPVGSDQPGWSAIDLRPDTSRVDGGGLSAALLHVPVAFTDARARFLANDKLESLTNPQKNFLTNSLGVDLSSPTLLRDIIATLLNNPPANGWKALRPARLRWEIWLGGERLWEAPRISGGATDDFNRANETPLAAPWVNSAFSFDVDSTPTLTSNTAQAVGIGMTYYSGAATSDDHYSVASVLGRDSGAAVRLAVGVTAFNGYVFECFGGGANCAKITNGGYSFVGGFGSSGITGAPTLRLEAEGSTFRAFLNGTPEANPQTDSSFASGQPGLWITGGATHAVDSWEGGDLAEPTSFQPARRAIGAGRW